MKSTGIVRPLDSLGRIVLPIELRRTMGLACKDPLEIFVENDMSPIVFSVGLPRI